jgi:hypothetical protein
MKYVLDTTAFSAVMKRDTRLVAFLRGYRPGSLPCRRLWLKFSAV